MTLQADCPAIRRAAPRSEPAGPVTEQSETERTEQAEEGAQPAGGTLEDQVTRLASGLGLPLAAWQPDVVCRALRSRRSESL